MQILQQFVDRLEGLDQWIKAAKWAESKQKERNGLLTTMLRSKKTNKLRRYRGKRGSRPN